MARIGERAKISDAAIEQYDDVIAGICKNEVVTVQRLRRLHPRPRRPGHVHRPGAPAVGAPGRHTQPRHPWVRGQAGPIQYLDTAALEHGEARSRRLPRGAARSSTGSRSSWTPPGGAATVVLPPGRTLTVRGANLPR